MPLAVGSCIKQVSLNHLILILLIALRMLLCIVNTRRIVCAVRYYSEDLDSLAFRMSSKSVVYIVRIRESKEYGVDDCFFALAMKGNSKVGHGEFEYLCEANKRGLLTKKVKNGKKDPTWEECVTELEEATPRKALL